MSDEMKVNINTVEKLRAMEAMNETAEDIQVDHSLGKAKVKKKTPHAIQVDRWSKRKAEGIVEEWGLDKPPEYAPEDVPRDEDGDPIEVYQPEDPNCLIADAHTACFEPNPQAETNCSDEVKRQWFEQLVQEPEFEELHAATMMDPELSQIASVRLYRQYQDYRTKLTQEEQDEIENGDNGGGPDGNNWGRKVNQGTSIRKAIEEAEKDVSDAKDAADAMGWGDSGGDPTAVEGSILDAFKKMRDNPAFRAISEAAGRFRTLAKSLQQQKTVHGVDDMVGVTLGDQIERMVPAELVQLVDPDLELELHRKIVEKGAMVREYKGIEHVGRGPIMVLVDESASMGGDPIVTAKGLALSLAWLARHQDRWCCLVGWASRDQVRKLLLEPGVNNADIMDWCVAMLNGGTEPPLHLVPELYDETGAPDGKTDILWITDGECRVDPETVESFNEWREKHECRIWTIGIGCPAESFGSFSDKTVQVSGLSTTEPVISEILSI